MLHPNSMDEKNKLTGLARYSPRLNLLKKFAGSVEPILSISSTYLLTDRTARRFGGIFEFIFLVVLPAITILFAAYQALLMLYGRDLISNKTDTLIMQSAFTVFLLFCLAGFISGFVISLLPGNNLRKWEKDNTLLRLFPIHPHDAYTNFIKLQAASFFLPVSVSIGIIYSILVFLECIMRRHYQPYITENYPNEILTDFTLFFSAVLVFILFFSILSISVSLNHRAMWASFIWLFAGIAVYIILSFFAFTYIMAYMDERLMFDPSMLALGLVALNIPLIGIAVWKARAAFRRCILPQK